MELIVIRLVSLVVIALTYMLFDLLNNRNIPAAFAYGSVAYGLLLTILYLTVHLIVISVSIAAVVFVIGYLVYRMGMLGAGDVFEFAALSLVLPIQATPLISRVPQLGIPFIIAIFIGSGVSALVLVPLYYLPRAKKMGVNIAKQVPNKDVLKALAIGVIYLIFIALLIIRLGVKDYGIALLVVMALGSVAVTLFERPITMSMARNVSVKDFEEGDIIAFNLMSRNQISALKRKLRNFDRLITRPLINEMKKKRVTTKVPVYKQAIPLAAPIFIGTVASILLGNLILLLLPI